MFECFDIKNNIYYPLLMCEKMSVFFSLCFIIMNIVRFINKKQHIETSWSDVNLMSEVIAEQVHFVRDFHILKMLISYFSFQQISFFGTSFRLNKNNSDLEHKRDR
jgi:hypothetical protein